MGKRGFKPRDFFTYKNQVERGESAIKRVAEIGANNKLCKKSETDAQMRCEQQRMLLSR